MWTLTQNIYRVTELTRAIQKTDLLKKAAANDLVIIHLGTNDIRDERPESEAYAELVLAATTISEKAGVPVYLSHIPPMDVSSRPKLRAKSAIFNTMLDTTEVTGVKILDVANTYKEHLNKDILDKDGFHLNQKGQKLLVDRLEESAKSAVPRSDPDQSTKNTNSRFVDAKKRKRFSNQNTESPIF